MERDEWEDFINYVDSLIKGKKDPPDPPAPKQDLKTAPSKDDPPVKVTMSPDGKYATSAFGKPERPKHGGQLPRYVGKVRCIDSAGDRCQLFVRVDDPEVNSPGGRAIIHIGFALDGDAESLEDYYLDITADQSNRLRAMLKMAEHAVCFGDVVDAE